MSDGSIRSARLVVVRPDDGIRGEGATFALHLMEGDTLVYESREFTGDDFHRVNPVPIKEKPMEGPVKLYRPDVCNVCGKKTYKCYYQIEWVEAANGGTCTKDGVAPVLMCICDECFHK